eukprot:CAMPEP_0114516494 /NCGR_PEP_ID=MMETSP0109-20121206/17359_1 /TAXON_ID=29199 /ORGANISM="Chlorarachnion reptans, Strain CCCM449" /LENGTH=120 /DNA_ID=CAMNT_0001696889 /DNA_START=65 /DNA_END=427 /DNA_ORIENTATION=-
MSLVRFAQRLRLVAKATTFRPVIFAQKRMFGEGGGSHFLPREDIEPRVLDCIKNFRDVDAGKVSTEANFSQDLGLDSLDTVELVLSFEDEFGIEIPEAEAETIQTANDAIKFIAATPFAK